MHRSSSLTRRRSSLDSESEALIQEEALWTLLAGRTAIVIAHRLSTVRRMNRLVVLERGAVVEQSTHDALVAGGSIFRIAMGASIQEGFLGTDVARIIA